MGISQTRPNINYLEHEQQFKKTSQDCQNGPLENRDCQDFCCLVTFILMTLIFIALGIYFTSQINSGSIDFMKNFYNNQNSTSTQQHMMVSENNQKHMTAQNNWQYHLGNMHDPVNIKKTADIPSLNHALPFIVLMCVMALILAFAVVILVSKAPQIMIYGMIIFTTIILVVGIILGLVIAQPAITITFSVFTLVWIIIMAVIFCCARQQFDAAIVLVKVAGSFIRHKPTVMLAPLFVLFIGSFYFIFWIGTLIAIQINRPVQQYSQPININQSNNINFGIHDVMRVVWIFFNIFYTYFLYYVMVFLVATATAIWYYNIEGNYLLKGLKYIFNSHIGSFTFASMIAAIISMIRSSTQNNNKNSNGCALCCICLVRCCLTFIQDIIKVLNHNAVIVMSVTGQSFIDSAKSAIYLIYHHFSLFVAIDFVQFILSFGILVFVVVLPTLIGLLLMNLTFDQDQSMRQTYLIIGGLIIFMISLLIGVLVITILSQTLSSIFIFFCLDQKFKQFNYSVRNRVPQQIRSLLNQISGESTIIHQSQLFNDQGQIKNDYEGVRQNQYNNYNQQNSNNNQQSNNINPQNGYRY